MRVWAVNIPRLTIDGRDQATNFSPALLGRKAPPSHGARKSRSLGGGALNENLRRLQRRDVAKRTG
jgi:hypothetical protein